MHNLVAFSRVEVSTVVPLRIVDLSYTIVVHIIICCCCFGLILFYSPLPVKILVITVTYTVVMKERENLLKRKSIAFRFSERSLLSIDCDTNK